MKHLSSRFLFWHEPLRASHCHHSRHQRGGEVNSEIKLAHPRIFGTTLTIKSVFGNAGLDEEDRKTLDDATRLFRATQPFGTTIDMILAEVGVRRM